MKRHDKNNREARATVELGVATIVTRGNDGTVFEPGGLRAKIGISHD